MPRPLILAALLLFCSIVFGLGINWGLPSRAADRHLFGDRTPWTGAQIMELIGGRPGGGLGADVDRDPLRPEGVPIVLNQTDAQRARIVLRYRLYSYQPDEMITFMSLAGMNPRRMQLDPKLYQYGGLWIYPVGGLLGVGGAAGLVDVKTDLTHYLDRPEAFGRFYVVARAYSAAWGVVGAAAVWWLVRRMTASLAAAAFAVVGYALLPVVVNMAHEAKPHLPAAAAQLLAMVAAAKYLSDGRWRWAILSGGWCGAAVSLILSAWPIVCILPAMLLVRRISFRQQCLRLIACAAVVGGVYAAANPFVVYHALSWGREENPLRSNLQNSKAMYRPALSAAGARDAARLLGYGATPVVCVLGAVGVVTLLSRRTTTDAAEPAAAERSITPRALTVLLLAPSAVILVQFLLLAAGKPGEYARFALFPIIALLICAVAGAWHAAAQARWLAVVVLVLMTARIAVGGASYLWHFLLDATEPTTRLRAADRLAALPGREIHLRAEPAPYSCPPVDLFDRRLILGGEPGAGGIALTAVDVPISGENQAVWNAPRLLGTPISWAAKPWVIRANPAPP